jgi:cell division septation protein DedD
MRGLFDGREAEREFEPGLGPAEPRRDPEWTLGAGALLGIFFALVLICGLCFGIGYSMGRRSQQETPLVLEPKPTSAPADNGKSKPRAAPPSEPSAAAQASASADSAGGPDANADSAGPASVDGAGTAKGATPVQPAVNSAADAKAHPAPGKIQPAPEVPPMVQIAAVSHPEDADVLVGALRKRGYAVVAKREPADGMIHVRIGPFASRDEANRWRQKLLNDGYNAIVQP